MKTSFRIKYYATYLCIVWLIFIFHAPQIYALPSNKILKTSFHKTDIKESIEIQTAKPPQFEVFKLDTPNRIVFTIENSYFPKIHQVENIFGQKANRFRISQNTKTQTRLVIDLIEDTKYQTKISELPNGNYLLRINIPKDVMPLVKKSSTIHPILVAQLEPSRPFKTVSPEYLKENELIQPIKMPPSLAPTTDLQNPPVEVKQQKNQTIVMMDDSEMESSIFDEDDEFENNEELNFSGSIQLRASIDTEQDKSNENKTSLKNRTIAKFNYKNKLVVSGISDYMFFGNQNETDDYTIDFYETYIRYNSSSFDISIGKQIKRWGKTDQISPVDTLNPENITEFIIPDYNERKMPVWMVDVVYKKKDFFIEGIVIPFFEPSKFNYFGTDWSIFSHLKDDIEDSSLTSVQKAYFDSISVNEKDPSSNIDNMEYALRIGGTIEQMDFGFTYHYAFEDLPNFQSFPVKNLSIDNPNSIQDLISNLGSLTLTNEKIETTYLRTNIFGFEFESTLNIFGIRGEAAYKNNESFLTRSFTSIRNPTLFWVIGADYTSSNNWYFNLQFAHQHIWDYDSSILFFDKNNYSVIGEINKDIFSDWLNASLQYTVMLNDNSYYLSPRLIYTYFKNTEVILGLNFFEGSENSILGRYNQNDQVFIDLAYRF
ncbi:MAG: AMIN domain-containing protein [Desulfobacteraceae bacterium]|nr:AMIN domain-containing protein [Desulfobacteraceae bacterium]